MPLSLTMESKPSKSTTKVIGFVFLLILQATTTFAGMLISSYLCAKILGTLDSRFGNILRSKSNSFLTLQDIYFTAGSFSKKVIIDWRLKSNIISHITVVIYKEITYMLLSN